jgi:cobalt/nickel transport system permease protein
MHLADGIVPISYALAGFAGSGALTAACLQRIACLPDPQARVPAAALVAAVFFVGALVSIPVPPVSVHLMLCGLIGILLGWFAMPVVLIGLFFQAILFGHGGLTTLGLNGLILGIPALLAFALWRLAAPDGRHAGGVGFALGAGGVVLAVSLFAAILLAGLPVHIDAVTERRALTALLVAHLPLAVIEGLVTAATLGFLKRADSGLLRHG